MGSTKRRPCFEAPRRAALVSRIGGLVGKSPHKKGLTFRQMRALKRAVRRLKEDGYLR